MSVRDSSIKAYAELRVTGLDGRVYISLRQNFPFGCSRRELAELMEMQASTMSGAVNRLIKRGVVEEQGTTVCSVSDKTVNKIVAVAHERNQ